MSLHLAAPAAYAETMRLALVDFELAEAKSIAEYEAERRPKDSFKYPYEVYTCVEWERHEKRIKAAELIYSNIHNRSLRKRDKAIAKSIAEGIVGK